MNGLHLSKQNILNLLFYILYCISVKCISSRIQGFQQKIVTDITNSRDRHTYIHTDKAIHRGAPLLKKILSSDLYFLAENTANSRLNTSHVLEYIVDNII